MYILCTIGIWDVAVFFDVMYVRFFVLRRFLGWTQSALWVTDGRRNKWPYNINWS